MPEPLEYESRLRPSSPPPALRAVAVIFVVFGVLALVDVVSGLFTGRLSLNFGILDIFVGRGILRLKPGWRTCGLAFLWIGMIAAGLMTVMALGGAKIRFAGLRLHGDSAVVLAAASGIAFFALNVWQYRVLTRPDVRRLFEQSK
jgi:hypothetical protein